MQVLRRIITHRVASALVLATAFTADTPDASAAMTAAGALQRSDTIVKLATRPRHPGGATLVPEMTIGSADGTAEYSFTSIGDVLIAHDGSVILIDHGTGPRGTPFVRHYGADGKHLRTIGAKGQGPGEYLSPAGLAQLADGRVLIRDGAGSRINVYSPLGETIDTWRLEGSMRIFSAGNLLLLDTAGTIYRRDQLRAGTRQDPSPPMGYIRMHANGTIIDTIFPPVMPALPSGSMQALVDGSGRTGSVPYIPTTTWAWSPLGYAVTGRTDRYAIDLRIPPRHAGGVANDRPPLWKEGDPVVSIRRDIRPIPIAEAERQARRDATQAFFRAVDPKWSWNGPDIPKTKPYFRAITIAQDGRILVTAGVPSERFTPEPTPNPTGRTDGGVPFREPTVYDVFEPDGTYLGQLRLPDRARIAAMKGDTAWMVVRDEDDVQMLQRFRLVWK